MSFPSDLTRTKTWSTEVLTASDLHAQLDLIINWAMAVVNSSTGHTHDGTSNQGPKINITNLTVGSQAQGDIVYASSSTAWARLGAGTSGYLLKTQGAGANPAWVAYSDYVTSSNALSGSVVQYQVGTTASLVDCSTAMPGDDTIPQNTEGTQVVTVSITPTNASNYLVIKSNCSGGDSGAGEVIGAIFQDSTANALVAGFGSSPVTNESWHNALTYKMTAGTTSATTFKLRIGASNGHPYVNGGISTGSTSRALGGVQIATIEVWEIKA